MADNQTFRSAFNGFNREDVVNYIAYITNQHETALNQLKSELEETCAERDELRRKLDETSSAEETHRDEDYEQLLQENAALEKLLEEQEQTIAQLRSREEAPAGEKETVDRKQEELLAYRRAESAERRAMSRVNQMFDQAAGVLGDVSALMGETSGRIGELAQRLNADLTELQAAISDSENTVSTATSMIGAIRPEAEGE